MSDQRQDQESYIRKVSEATRQYAQELLRENESLRAAVAVLESEKVRLTERVRSLGEELEVRRQEELRLQEALAETENENRRFSERYMEVEQQSANLANLYVASYRLHGTLDRAEVIAAIQEIVANLIGSEELAIFELDREGEALSLVASFNVDHKRYASIQLGEGSIGKAASEGETFVCDEGNGDGSAEEPYLSACIPLKLDGRVIGAIAVFRLLPQKNGFEALDRELFDLLATQSATALYATGLHERRGAEGGER